MAGNTSLKDLIEALASAVISAQERIEQHQISNLSGYFDENNRPKSVMIRLPSLAPGATQDDEDHYRAPLLPLVSTNLLRIKDVEITFDVELGDLNVAGGGAPASDKEAGDERWRRDGDAKAHSINVDTRAGFLGRKGGNVHIVLRVEGTEPSEGSARLMNHLAQTQGVVKTVRIE